MSAVERVARATLDAIYDDVDHRLNPNDEECWHCGGEGETFDCFDGFCADAELGCPDCTRPCPECRQHSAARAKAVREAVVKTGDIDLAIEWIKSVGRWRDDITREEVKSQIVAAQAAIDAALEETK